MDRDGVVALLTEIVRGAPSLPEAACVDQYRLYDEIPGRGHQHHDQERIRLAKAAQVCATCPVRVQCPTVVTTNSTSITVAVGMRRASTRVRTSIPPPPGTLPLAN